MDTFGHLLTMLELLEMYLLKRLGDT